MARNWTAEQKQAICARGGGVLVSAAAGSGKTAVLVERIVQKLADPDHPCDIDRLLTVTFTNAAAAEMRERIAKRLSDALALDPHNAHLRRQQLLLGRAHISTIHAFCLDLLRDNFHTLGLSPDFRIADENELAVIRQEALDEVFEASYADADKAPLFGALVELLSSEKNDNLLAQTVLRLYEFIGAHPFPLDWLDEMEAMYAPDKLDNSLWIQTILSYASEASAHALSLLRGAMQQIEPDAVLRAAYLPAFADAAGQLEEIERYAKEAQFDALCVAADGFAFPRLKAVRNHEDEPLRERVKAAKESAVDTVAKLKEVLCSTLDECREDIAVLAPMMHTLFDTVRAFTHAFNARKAEKNLLDFSDLEHQTIRLLVEKRDGKLIKTDRATALAAAFDEILVDEYQDTNKAQDMIFWALSDDERNLFIVGDSKQSIYSFRQAMPELFLGRREAAHPYDGEHFPAAITLGKNFRSRKGVTAFVNFVFSQLMSKQVGQIDYDENERLIPGAVYDEGCGCDVDIDLVEDDGSADKDLLEARHIASRIIELMNSQTVYENGKSRPCAFGDICILLRSTKDRAQLFVKELLAAGIPAVSEVTGQFFASSEIKTMLSLLRALDNPTRDVSFVSVLLSELYGFTPDELTDIRAACPQESLYACAAACAQEDSMLGRKCAALMRDFSALQALARTLPADQMIAHIYDYYSYRSLVKAMPNAALRTANLALLLDYARTFEAAGYCGVSGFVRFLDKLYKQRRDPGAAAAQSGLDCVHVMSIHASKGLEFPICFVSGTHKLFNREDLRRGVLVHAQLGAACARRDMESLTQYSTLPLEALKLGISRSIQSEELRILYVALTRAREKLILTGVLKNPQERVRKLAASLPDGGDVLSPFVVLQSTSFLNLLLLCTLRHPGMAGLLDAYGVAGIAPFAEGEPIRVQIVRPAAPESAQVVEEDPCPADEQLLHLIEERLSYVYPYAAQTQIPTKLSVSQIAKDEQGDLSLTTPAFRQEEGLSPAERGTALHKFMQFVRIEEDGFDPARECERLVRDRFLTSAEGDAVDLARIERFLQSPLFVRIKASDRILRELKFTMELPLCELDQDSTESDPVVVQGVIDLLFIENGRGVIVDYKTDAVQNSQQLIDRYRTQLLLYKKAAAACYGIEDAQCAIYSFGLGETVELD